MGKRRKGNKGRTGGITRKRRFNRPGGGSKDVIGLVTNENVILGAVVGVGSALLIDAIGSRFVPNIHARNALKAIVPAVGAQMFLKNPMVTTTAAATGLALAAGAYMETFLKTNVPQTKGLPNTFAQTAGMIGEEVFREDASYPPSQAVIEMEPGVNGEYQQRKPVARVFHDQLAGLIVYDANGVPFEVAEGVSGELNDDDVSGGLDGEYDEEYA